jgi:hypothetical protein
MRGRKKTAACASVGDIPADDIAHRRQLAEAAAQLQGALTNP